MYRFYSKPIGKRRVTVVGEITKGYLNIAIAISNDKDVFVRKIGRTIAEGRLNSGKLHSKIPCTKEKMMSEEFIKIAENIAITETSKFERRKRK